jgi:hypothetical protein
VDFTLDHGEVGAINFNLTVSIQLRFSCSLFADVRCDENDIWTGRIKDPSITRATYNTAQKMRAAMSHKFGRDYRLGTMPWVENPSIPGKYIGNPSLSVAVSQYMISLRRRKVSIDLGHFSEILC